MQSDSEIKVIINYIKHNINNEKNNIKQLINILQTNAASPLDSANINKQNMADALLETMSAKDLLVQNMNKHVIRRLVDVCDKTLRNVSTDFTCEDLCGMLDITEKSAKKKLYKFIVSNGLININTNSITWYNLITILTKCKLKDNPKKHDILEYIVNIIILTNHLHSTRISSQQENPVPVNNNTPNPDTTSSKKYDKLLKKYTTDINKLMENLKVGKDGYDKLVETHNNVLNEKNQLMENLKVGKDGYDKLIETHNNVVNEKNQLIDDLETSKQAYTDLAKKYNTIVEEKNQLVDDLEAAENTINDFIKKYDIKV